MCRAVGFGTKRPAPVAGFHRALPSTTRDKAIYFLQRLSYHIPAGLSRAKIRFLRQIGEHPGGCAGAARDCVVPAAVHLRQYLSGILHVNPFRRDTAAPQGLISFPDFHKKTFSTPFTK